MESQTAKAPDIEQIRARVKAIGMLAPPEPTDIDDELRHYFTNLVFGISARLHTIEAALKKQDLERERAGIQSQQSGALEELKLCSDIFHALHHS
jgi:hypothetical protein